MATALTGVGPRRHCHQLSVMVAILKSRISGGTRAESDQPAPDAPQPWQRRRDLAWDKEATMPGDHRVTPTTDTNQFGHCRTGADAWNASTEASDSAGQFGRALQAGGHSCRAQESEGFCWDLRPGQLATGVDAASIPVCNCGSTAEGG